MTAKYVGSPFQKRQTLRKRIQEIEDALSNRRDPPELPPPPNPDDYQPTIRAFGYDDVPSDEFGELMAKQEEERQEGAKRFEQAQKEYEQKVRDREWEVSSRGDLEAELERHREELKVIEGMMGG